MSKSVTKRLIQCPVHGEVEPNISHIAPRSRGGKNDGNINRETCPLCHEYYHWLFSNLLPDEIIAYLVKNFWNGQVKWAYRFLSDYESREDGWLSKGSKWPESWANWSMHTAEAKSRLMLESAKESRNRHRNLGLGAGDYVVFDEKSREVVATLQRGAGRNREDAEKVLGRKLHWYESVRPIIRQKSPLV